MRQGWNYGSFGRYCLVTGSAGQRSYGEQADLQINSQRRSSMGDFALALGTRLAGSPGQRSPDPRALMRLPAAHLPLLQ